MVFYRVDTRAFPYVRVSFQGLPEADADFQAFIDELTALYARKAKFSILFDTTGFKKALPAVYIKGIGAWIRENHDNAKQYLECSAVLIQNPLVLVFLKAVLALVKTASPLHVKDNMRDCVAALKWKVPGHK